MPPRYLGTAPDTLRHGPFSRLHGAAIDPHGRDDGVPRPDGHELPDLIESGRLVQGYDVSGPLPPTVAAAIDRDLHDPLWRTRFHTALRRDRRLQRGLFEPSHSLRIGDSLVPSPAALLRLMDDSFRQQAYDLGRVRALSKSSATLEEGYHFEYGLALVKTSAALAYTQTLALAHELQPVTDSPRISRSMCNPVSERIG